MASDAKINLTLSGNGTLLGTAGLTTPQSVLQLGQGSWPAMVLALTFGAGNNQIKNWYQALRTLAAGGNDDLDLSGGLSNELGDVNIPFLAIKLCLIAIDAPDGIKSVKVGPGAGGAALANAFVGPWVAAADSCVEVQNFCPVINSPWGGYAVTPATGDLLRIHNPGAGPVTYRILLGGTV